jgi:nicotinamidase-related amidase
MELYTKMIEYLGKTIFTTLPELVDPKHTAFVIVDIQNDAAFKEEKETYPHLLPNVKSLLETARKAGVFVVYIKDTLLKNRISDSPGYIRRYMISRKLDHPSQITMTVVEGSWGQQFPDEIAPLENEVIVRKYRSSAFYGTPLDMLLRNNNTKTLVIVGLATEGCVASTCRDAGNEYFVVVIKDAVVTASGADIQEAALKILASRYDMATTQEVVNEWNTS